MVWNNSATLCRCSRFVIDHYSFGRIEGPHEKNCPLYVDNMKKIPNAIQRGLKHLVSNPFDWVASIRVGNAMIGDGFMPSLATAIQLRRARYVLRNCLQNLANNAARSAASMFPRYRLWNIKNRYSDVSVSYARTMKYSEECMQAWAVLDVDTLAYMWPRRKSTDEVLPVLLTSLVGGVETLATPGKDFASFFRDKAYQVLQDGAWALPHAISLDETIEAATGDGPASVVSPIIKGSFNEPQKQPDTITIMANFERSTLEAALEQSRR